KDWPLLVFLHGSGERGDDLEKVRIHGPPKLIAEGKQFPFIVVSPQGAPQALRPGEFECISGRSRYEIPGGQRSDLFDRTEYGRRGNVGAGRSLSRALCGARADLRRGRPGRCTETQGCSRLGFSRSQRRSGSLEPV